MSELNFAKGTKFFRTTKIQRAYYVGRQADLPLGGMECSGYMTFTGKALDEERLRLAIDIVSAHPALRMRFINADQLCVGDDVQAPKLKVHHLHRTKELEHDSIVRNRMLVSSIDLTAGRLWDVELTHWHDGGSTLHIGISLAVVDLIGLSALMHHLLQSYQGDSLLSQFISAEQLYHRLNENQLRMERKRNRSSNKLEKLACKCMATLPPPPDLPFTFFIPIQKNKNDAMLRRSKFYDAQQWTRLREYASKISVAPSALVLALYTRALRQYSAISDFVVTVTNLSVTGTEMELAERTVTYAHRARRLQSFNAMARDAHDDLRYRLLRGVDCETEIREVLADASCSHPGVSPYIFTYAAQKPIFNHQIVDNFGQPRMWGQTPQAVIDCQVFMPTEQKIEVAFDVRCAAIAPDVEKGIFELFTESIDDIIAGRQPDRLLPRSCRSWRVEVNSTPVASPPEMLYSRFRRQVQEQPLAIALVCPAVDPDLSPELVDPLVYTRKTRQWSYAELEQLALRLAARLAVHTVPKDIIGIRLPKGPAQIVAALAALYVGCAYLPVGLDMPDERLTKIKHRSEMRYLLTASDFDQLDLQKPLAKPRTQIEGGNPEDLAYVIFTSGSTGEPKGVAVSHRAANNTIVDINIRHKVTQNDVLLAVSSLDFDLSVYDIFGPLGAGATIICINENERRDAFSWVKYVNEYHVTLWNSVPALAEMLLVATDHLPSVRNWFCSGDWIAPSLFSELKKIAPNSILVAMGGSTETAIWSNEYVIRSEADLKSHWTSVPYGLPLSGQQYRVVREDGFGGFEDCQDGVIGELWIGGEGLAQEYLGDFERTFERFVNVRVAPDSDLTRWYRTGDLGYWREKLLFFVGREDTQVKIQGHRVECGEVEQVLKNISGIEHAVVVPIRQRRALGAVLVSHEISLEQLRQLLFHQLPHYMIPAKFLICKQLVLSRNGKIDRAWASKELENEEYITQSDTFFKTSDAFNACLTIWRQVLKQENIGPDDNFFALGGDSLAATRVCALLQSQGIEVAVGELFATSTLNDFVLRCQASTTYYINNEKFEADPVEPFPLTSLQQAYVLGSDGIPGVSRCDTVFSTIIRNVHSYPLAHWQQSLNELICETAALRMVRTEAQQQVMAPCLVPVVILPKEADLRTYLSNTPFDSRMHPPVRLVIVEGDLALVGLMFNYLSLDALSLIRITLALIEKVTGKKNGYKLENHIVPFLNYAGQLSQKFISSSEWESETWLPPVLKTAYEMPDVSSVKSFTFHISSVMRRELETQVQQNQATLSALIFKFFGESLITLCERQNVVIVVPVCWRPLNSPQALGQFTHLRLCRYAVDNTVTKVSRELGEAVAGKTPDVRYIATRGRAVYPFVFTSMVGIPEVEKLNRIETRLEWSHTRTPGVLIDCQVIPVGDGLEIRWDYAANILDHSLLTTAYKVFVSKLTQEQKRNKNTADSVFLPKTFIDGLNGRQIATRAIAAALGNIENVPVPLLSVIDAWKNKINPASDPAWFEVGRFLASCIHGERPRNDLLSHQLLAPEQLLLVSLKQLSFFDSLIADLKMEFLRLNPVRSALRVLVLGSGSGIFGKTLIAAAAENGLSLRLDEYETNDALKKLAPCQDNIIEVVPDVVIAPASLHRDKDLLVWLTNFLRTEQNDLQVRIHVLEVTEPDAASLIAALLDPMLVDDKQSPLITYSGWMQRLVKIGADVEWVNHLANNLIWIKATLHASHLLVAQPQPSVLKLTTVEIEELVAKCWKKVLGLNYYPISSDDFFALGGDSLRATQIVMALRQQEIGAIRLADLFNYPKFSDFVQKVKSQCIFNSKQVVVSSDNVITYPLTPVQKAYLAGRSPDQILGGVASHCYFEFNISTSEGINIDRWKQALNLVISRHDALRSLIVWHNNEPLGQVNQQTDCLYEVSSDVRALTEAENPNPVKDYPLRVRLSPDGKTIGIGMDNLMLDGVSMFLVMRELGSIYQGKKLPPSAIFTYAQYRHSRQKIKKNTAVTQEMPPAPSLPWITPLKFVNEIQFERCAQDIKASQWLIIRQWASEHKVTPASLLLGAYALEIAEIANNAKFSLNVTTFERDPDVSDVTSLVGDFTQLGLVAFDFSFKEKNNKSRIELVLEQARVAHQGILTIHDKPDQVNTLSIAREIVRQQGDPMAGLFPVVFTCGLGLHTAMHRSDDFGFGTMTYARSQTPQVAMDFQVHDDSRGLHITVDYVTALLKTNLVEALTSGVAERLNELVIITEDTKCESMALSATIARIWREHLPITEEIVPNNFFQSGGDSLQATRCIRALQKEIDPRISLRLLLVYPRFSDFCEQVVQILEKTETKQVMTTSGIKNNDFDEGML